MQNIINMKRTFNLLMAMGFIMFAILFIPFNTAYAEDTEDTEESEKYTVSQPLLDSLTTGQYGEFKSDGKSYYYVDAVTERDVKLAKSSSIWTDIKDSLFGWSDFSGNFMEKFNSLLLMYVNTGMKINIFLTDALIMVLGFSMDFDIVKPIVDKVGQVIANITGVNGTSITGGLFGNLLLLILTLVSVYLLYVFVIRRAMIESFSHLVKTIIALVVAMAIFTNYSAYIIGANNIANETTKVVLESVNKVSSNDNIKDTLWTILVDRPYLTLQYGTYDSNEIGKERIYNILKTPYGEERQQKVLINEVVKNNNEMMVSTSVLDRIAFTLFYFGVNTVVAIPILMLALMLLALQFWYIAVVLIAPFTLLVSLFPNSFGILKRYSVEVMIPLALKVFFAFFTVIILFIAQIVYEINVSSFSDSSLLGYVIVGVIQAIIFIVIFMLRKRIAGIFTKGSNFIGKLREEAETINPMAAMKKSAQVVTQLTATGVGAMFGGVQGAQVGNSLGKLAGKAITGDTGVSESVDGTLRSATQAKMLTQMASSKGDNPPELSKSQTKDINRFMDLNGIEGEDMRDNVLESLQQEGLGDATYDEMKSSLDTVMTKFDQGELQTSDLGKELTNNIKQNRLDASNNTKFASMSALSQKMKKPKYGSTDKAKDNNTNKETLESAFVKDNFSQYTPNELAPGVDILLNELNMNDATPEEIEKHLSEISSNAKQPMSKDDLSTTIAGGIAHERQEKKDQKQDFEKDPVYSSVFGQNAKEVTNITPPKHHVEDGQSSLTENIVFEEKEPVFVDSSETPNYNAVNQEVVETSSTSEHVVQNERIHRHTNVQNVLEKENVIVEKENKINKDRVTLNENVEKTTVLAKETIQNKNIKNEFETKNIHVENINEKIHTESNNKDI